MLNPESREGLVADIDTRLLDLWTPLWREGPHPLSEALADEAACALLAALLRQAYGQGYNDALQEDREGRRGELARRHGYRHD